MATQWQRSSCCAQAAKVQRRRLSDAAQMQRRCSADAAQMRRSGSADAAQWQRSGGALAAQWQCSGSEEAVQWQRSGSAVAAQGHFSVAYGWRRVHLRRQLRLALYRVFVRFREAVKGRQSDVE